MRTQQETRRDAVHEAAHSVLAVVIMRGVIFCDIKETDTTGGWTQYVDFETVKTADGVFPYVVCNYAGYASTRLLLGLNHDAHELCKTDFALIEKEIAFLSEDDRRRVRWQGITESLLLVNRYREQILELADSLMAFGRVNGDRVRGIVERPR
jgi:hypothetical protein